jgi:hypothetical protein
VSAVPLRDKISDAALLTAMVVLLTGCALQAPPPRPVEVSLDRSTLALRLADGARCTAPVSGIAGRFSTTVTGAGTFADCPVPYAYTVTGDPGTNPLRFVLEEGFTVLGLAEAIAPRATVEIAAPDGRRWRFVSPPEADAD